MNLHMRVTLFLAVLGGLLMLAFVGGINYLCQRPATTACVKTISACSAR
jgi:hypothetical protein